MGLDGCGRCEPSLLQALHYLMGKDLQGSLESRDGRRDLLTTWTKNMDFLMCLRGFSTPQRVRLVLRHGPNRVLLPPAVPSASVAFVLIVVLCVAAVASCSTTTAATVATSSAVAAKMAAAAPSSTPSINGSTGASSEAATNPESGSTADTAPSTQTTTATRKATSTGKATAARCSNSEATPSPLRGALNPAPRHLVLEWLEKSTRVTLHLLHLWWGP